ncbi:MAG: galactitol-1-phosphate 5-dehydrogenase [Chthonomonadales bacterium]|nr:galactitol-1-phosphate 5-dehydrogenase [Chthonomonadales bacterium]
MTEAMQALVLHGIGDLRLEERPVPTPGAREVLVRMGWCGLCGSDIPRIFITGAHHRPIVPGHEMAGVVQGVGSDVTEVQPGTRVVVFPLVWCGSCPACELGRYAQCADYGYLGSRSDGGFAEYVIAPAANVRVIPDGVPLDVAALTEPSAVALHAVRRTGVSLGGLTAAVFGAGPIGLLTAMWARLLGALRVVVFDPVPERLDLARRCGMTLAYDPRDRAPREVISGLTGGYGAAVCFEAAGVTATVLEACACVAAGGSVVLVGNPATDVVLPKNAVSRLLRMEASVLGVWNSTFNVHAPNDDWSTTLAAMADVSLNVAPLISHRVPLREALAVLRGISERRVPSMKVLIGDWLT